MALKDRIADDISRCFMNMEHFAETHYWNGREITCIPDEEEAIKRKNNNVNDISWDNNSRSLIIHVPLENFPGGEPEPNTHVIYDKKPMKVLVVNHNMGVLDITLSAADPRDIV
jgi:hypothetical protein